MTIDVVVVAYQSASLLPTCLRPLPHSAHVIVVDNHSSDGSAYVAENLGAEVIRNSENRGFGAAANQGAAVGDGALILFLNPDAHLTADGLGALARELEDNPRLASVGPALRFPSGKAQRGWWPYPSPGRTWAEALGLHHFEHSATCSSRAVPFVVGTCMLVRRQAFEALGGFDTTFWLYAEEADFCRRAWSNGWEVRYVADVTAIHAGGASSADEPGIAFEHFQRGAEHFIAKHHGPASLVVHRLGLLVGSLVRLPALAIRPGPDTRARLATRRAVISRLVRILATHPTQVRV